MSMNALFETINGSLSATEMESTQHLRPPPLLLQPFYGSLDFVQDNPGEPVPEGTFCDLLDFLVQNEDNTGRRTKNLDGVPPHPH